MKKKTFASFVVFAGVSLLLAACGSKSASNSAKKTSSASSSQSRITMVGSTALQPLAEAAAKDYMKTNSHVTIDVQGGGSGTGLSQIQSGAVSVGNSDIFAEQQKGVDASKIVDHKVAVVGMAPVVNKALKLNNLSMSQLQGIFTGKIKNWKQVGGPDEAIVVINRVKGSGTRMTFENAVLKGKTAITAQEQDSNGTVQKLVAQTAGAISYLAFPYVKTDNIKAVKVDGVAPTNKNVETNKWKIWSYEHMYTKGQAKGALKKFLTYMKSKKIQDSYVKKLGYISIIDMKVEKNASGKVTNQ